MQWVHVRDVARAAMLAADTDKANGRAYNLAGHPPVTQIEYVRLLADIAGTRADLVPVPRERIQRLGGMLFAPPFYFGVYLDIPAITVHNDRARSELGVEFTPLDEGLRETYRWYRAQAQPRPDFAWEDSVLSTE